MSGSFMGCDSLPLENIRLFERTLWRLSGRLILSGIIWQKNDMAKDDMVNRLSSLEES